MWVKSEFQKVGLEVEVVNVDQDEEAKQIIIDAGFLSVPVLELDGKLVGDVQEIVSQIELIPR